MSLAFAAPPLASASSAVEQSSGSMLRAAWEQGPLAFLILVAIVLVSAGLFIYAAASMAGVENRSFLKAVKAAALAWFLSLVVAFLVGFGCGVAGVDSDAARIAAIAVCALLPGTLAIRTVYEASWPKALWTWLLASVLTIVVLFTGLFALSRLQA
jgi:hypothetical protein